MIHRAQVSHRLDIVPKVDQQPKPGFAIDHGREITTRCLLDSGEEYRNAEEAEHGTNAANVQVGGQGKNQQTEKEVKAQNTEYSRERLPRFVGA